MKSDIPELDASGLRRFGLIFALIITTIFGIIFPLLSGTGVVLIPWVVGSVFLVWALVAPRTIRPFYRLWMRFGFLMSAIMNRLILGIVFYLLILPFGIVLRLRGLDPLNRKWSATSKSYRVTSDQASPGDMRRPF